MPWEQFSDDCAGCRPAVLDMETRQPLPDNHPIMQKILKVWNKTTLEQRKAYHAVMCQNSRSTHNLKLVEEITRQMQEQLDEARG